MILHNSFGTVLLPIVLGSVSIGLSSLLPVRPTCCCCCCCRLLKLWESRDLLLEPCCVYCAVTPTAAFVSYKAVHTSDLLLDD